VDFLQFGGQLWIIRKIGSSTSTSAPAASASATAAASFSALTSGTAASGVRWLKTFNGVLDLLECRFDDGLDSLFLVAFNRNVSLSEELLDGIHRLGLVRT